MTETERDRRDMTADHSAIAADVPGRFEPDGRPTDPHDEIAADIRAWAAYLVQRYGEILMEVLRHPDRFEAATVEGLWWTIAHELEEWGPGNDGLDRAFAYLTYYGGPR